MNQTTEQWMRIGRWAVVTLGVIVLVLFIWQEQRLPKIAATEAVLAGPDEPSDAAWREPPDLLDVSWGVLRAVEGAPTGENPLKQRFRLAGTFFAYPDDPASLDRRARQAILDDIREQRQRIVQEGDAIEQIEVVRIFRDRVVLRDGSVEEELRLSYREVSADPSAPVGTELDPDVPLRFEDLPALDTHRFGKRIGENRWIMQREALLQYADEIQQDPERLTALIMAMQPAYDADDEITGFTLDKLGEDILYEAAGMRDGDVVRRVNSMPMTSPARAQYFISEFMQGRVNAIVLDIERDGEEAQLIHLIR